MKKHFDVIELLIIEKKYSAVYAEDEAEAIDKVKTGSMPFNELSRTGAIKKVKLTVFLRGDTNET